MTISVLSQGAVDTLRMIVKNMPAKRETGSLLDMSFDDMVDEFNLQMLDIEVAFDNKTVLTKPEGIQQDKNYDLQNCMAITSALAQLTDIDATDERLWVTLGFREFKDYAISRWPAKSKVEEPQNTLNHWFARGTRALMRDHAISRLWWRHRQCSRIEGQPVGETLDLILFNSDYRDNMLDRNTTSAIPEVVATIIEITYEYKKKGINYDRDKFRKFMMSLNLLAGRSRLAVLSKHRLKTKLTDLYLSAYN
tara:strand:+ start:760 stop:1512 length:753 start_codon:yes stop_codon:yes gene_type:complete